MDSQTAFSDEWLVPIIADLLSPEAVEELRGEAEPQQSLWELVVGHRLLPDDQILSALGTRFRVPIADLTKTDAKVRDIVPEGVARRYRILPLRVTASHLEIATANPFDLDAEKSLAFATGREVRTLLAAPARILEKLDELYHADEALERMLQSLRSDADIEQLADEAPDEISVSEKEASQQPIVRAVDLILSEGILQRASDIHIETEEDGVAVRYRIDGVLRQVMKLPRRRVGLPLISRIKIISGLDIADRLRPQDGRARVAVNGMPVDLRVSTLPASVGEKVVIRILDSRGTVLSVDSLGMNPDETRRMKELLRNRDGIILVTGPTGSGKTTTLYGAIREIQSEGVNIVTVEDPVEYRMPGIVQVQVHEKTGLTFASALRSILRQDPDVVLVGEIRDRETAQIAVQASLTGHLVLATLHTNDAANALTRLVDIGVEPYKIGSALRGVIAQRLIRRLCPSCKEVVVGAPENRLRRWIPRDAKLYRAGACPECAMTGFRGRFAIVEVLVVTPEIERLVVDGATADRIAAAAHGAGGSMWDSGVYHVLRGESTFEELERVVEMPAAEAPNVTVRRAASSRAVTRGEIEVVENAGPEPNLASQFELIGGLDAAEALESRTVLLVEDEDPLRRVMKDLLERDGFVVAEARDGMEALDQVDRVGPDVIVLDLNLPGLDGYGVLSQLRSRPQTASIPVIVLTAKGDEDNEVRVFELGADDFLTKPFRARALSARLDVLLRRRRRPA